MKQNLYAITLALLYVCGSFAASNQLAREELSAQEYKEENEKLKKDIDTARVFFAGLEHKIKRLQATCNEQKKALARPVGMEITLLQSELAAMRVRVQAKEQENQRLQVTCNAHKEALTYAEYRQAEVRDMSKACIGLRREIIRLTDQLQAMKGQSPNPEFIQPAISSDIVALQEKNNRLEAELQQLKNDFLSFLHGPLRVRPADEKDVKIDSLQNQLIQAHIKFRELTDSRKNEVIGLKKESVRLRRELLNKNKLIREKDEQIDLLQNQLAQAHTQPRELTDSREAFGCQPIQTTADQRKLLGAIKPLSQDEKRSVSRAIFCSNF